MAIALVVAGAWSAGLSRRTVEEYAPPSTRTLPVLDDTNSSDASYNDADAESRRDLYGNEIVDAVGDYRIDVRGDVYERHSPTTEVTQLAAPSL
jgi:hypothetical protein